MEIVIKKSEDENGAIRERLLIDGKQVANVYPLCECPEDAIIGRSLISCTEISEFIQRGYEANRRGERLIIKTEIDDE